MFAEQIELPPKLKCVFPEHLTQVLPNCFTKENKTPSSPLLVSFYLLFYSILFPELANLILKNILRISLVFLIFCITMWWN